MKLSREVPFLVERFSKIRDLPAYVERLKQSGKYKDFETRLAWDCIHAAVPTDTVCGWYEQYSCNDSHITTAAKTALKQLNII